MNEIASFLTFSLRNVKAGIDMAKLALRLNPTSSQLWNTLGDSLFEFGRIAEARQAYLRAQQLNPNDARTYYNLAWVYAREKNYPAGLEQIAEALARDETGEYRERLLHKQGEILDRLARRNQQDYLRMANRISTAPARPSEANGKLGHNGWDGSPESKVPPGPADQIPLMEPTHLGRSEP